MKRALTIGASDSSGAAGVQGDLRVFQRCGVYGACAVVLIAARDTFAVRRVFQPAPTIIGAQIDAVVKDLGADACKIGWLRSPEVVGVVAGRVRRRGLRPVVLDPCLWSERGEELTPPSTVKRLVRDLLPLVTVLTVTVRELGVLAGVPVGSAEEIGQALERARSLGPESIVVEDAAVEGGAAVLVGDAGGVEAVAVAPGEPLFAGRGEVFSAALTAALARGDGLHRAAEFAAGFVTETARDAVPLGKGLPIAAWV